MEGALARPVIFQQEPLRRKIWRAANGAERLFDGASNGHVLGDDIGELVIGFRSGLLRPLDPHSAGSKLHDADRLNFKSRMARGCKRWSESAEIWRR